MKGLGAACVALAVLFVGEQAHACAACTTGDPTLTAFGSDKPHAGRLRVALDVRSREDHIGEAGVDRVDVAELRTELGVAWAPSDDVFLQLALPLLWRDVAYADDASSSMLASGDLGFRMKVALGAGFSLSAGLSLPTAPVVYIDGKRLPIEAQPGTGSFDPALGIGWSLSDRDVRPWAFGASAWGVWPTGAANPQLRLVMQGQRELWRDGAQAFALRAVLEGRIDGRAFEGGQAVRSSGGFISFGGIDLSLAPATDWQVELGLRVPIINALRGDHNEGIIATASIAWDAL